MTTQTETLLAKLTEERDAVANAREPVKLRVTFELTIPPDVEAAAYKAALVEALQAFARCDIGARVRGLLFAPTRTTPSIEAR